MLEKLFPQWALSRAKARAQLSVLTEATMDYDAARRSRRTAGFRYGDKGPSGEVMSARDRLRAASRDMVRNHPIAVRVPQVIAQNVVGAGIIPHAIPTSGRDSAKKTTKARVEAALKDHFDTPECDAEGRLDLYGLQFLAKTAVVRDGECFVLRVDAPDSPTPFRWRLRVLEADYLDTTKRSVGADERIINGIEYDAQNRPIAYWLYDEHPRDVTRIQRLTSTRYSASRVCHLFRIDRPGQCNGVSWLAPVLIKIGDVTDLSDARAYREKVAGCFSAFIHSNDDAAEGLGGASKSDKSHFNYPLEGLEPGTITHLRNGDSVTFGSPPQVEGYSEFWRAQALEIAMGVGLSYPTLTGDMSQGNFAMGRMGWLEDQRAFDSWRSSVMMSQFLWRVGSWIKVGISTRDTFDIGWTAPAREMIDPSKDTRAALEAIKGNIKSRDQVIRSLGRDPEDVDAEILEARARLPEEQTKDPLNG
ncbi:MAG: phage portal protein [Pseudomonadota bacterium]